MALIEVGLLTVGDLKLLSKRTVVVDADKHGQPKLSMGRIAKADFVVVRTHKGMVLAKSRYFDRFAIGQRVFPDGEFIRLVDPYGNLRRGPKFIPG